VLIQVLAAMQIQVVAVQIQMVQVVAVQIQVLAAGGRGRYGSRVVTMQIDMISISIRSL